MENDNLNGNNKNNRKKRKSKKTDESASLMASQNGAPESFYDNHEATLDDITLRGGRVSERHSRPTAQGWTAYAGLDGEASSNNQYPGSDLLIRSNNDSIFRHRMTPWRIFKATLGTLTSSLWWPSWFAYIRANQVYRATDDGTARLTTHAAVFLASLFFSGELAKFIGDETMEKVSGCDMHDRENWHISSCLFFFNLLVAFFKYQGPIFLQALMLLADSNRATMTAGVLNPPPPVAEPAGNCKDITIKALKWTGLVGTLLIIPKTAMDAFQALHRKSSTDGAQVFMIGVTVGGFIFFDATGEYIAQKYILNGLTTCVEHGKDSMWIVNACEAGTELLAKGIQFYGTSLVAALAGLGLAAAETTQHDRATLPRANLLRMFDHRPVCLGGTDDVDTLDSGVHLQDTSAYLA